MCDITNEICEVIEQYCGHKVKEYDLIKLIKTSPLVENDINIKYIENSEKDYNNGFNEINKEYYKK